MVLGVSTDERKEEICFDEDPEFPGPCTSAGSFPLTDGMQESPNS